MRYLNEVKEGEKVKEIYLCKKVSSAQTKAGKTYWNVTLQDKTGTVDGKVWDPDSPGIDDFSDRDYIWVVGEVTIFNGMKQMNIRQARKAGEGEYEPGEYLPCTEKNTEEMYVALLGLIDAVKTPYFNSLLNAFFKDEEFKRTFSFHSAAKSVHHGFVGGLLEHTLSVAQICDFFGKHYDYLDHDLLVTAAILHDIGKLKELSPYPDNDYTDDGQLLGHIVMGAEMVREKIRSIPDFPKVRESELIHCILAHHGELEFGSPKKPAIAEAVALSFADNADAKIETMKEALNTNQAGEWQGYNKFMESNIRRTT
ncbi:MAG: HD domain-containing protein [Lachnospiraceae bacterium]|nr:HD domain-containing protein [Lachnospiraceae bacterium]